MAKRKSKNRKKVIMVVLGCCCIIAAATLVTYNYLDQARAARESQELMDRLAALLAEGSLPADYVSEIDGQLQEGEGEDGISARWVDGYDICGVLSVPKININLAVIRNWNYANLTVSVCRYSGNPDEKMILLGHNYRGHFGDLNKLKAGNAVRFTDAEGVVYDYTVTLVEVFAADQMWDIISGDTWDLTLFTCTYGGSERVVVRCSRA